MPLLPMFIQAGALLTTCAWITKIAMFASAAALCGCAERCCDCMAWITQGCTMLAQGRGPPTLTHCERMMCAIASCMSAGCDLQAIIELHAWR